MRDQNSFPILLQGDPETFSLEWEQEEAELGLKLGARYLELSAFPTGHMYRKVDLDSPAVLPIHEPSIYGVVIETVFMVRSRAPQQCWPVKVHHAINLALANGESKNDRVKRKPIVSAIWPGAAESSPVQVRRKLNAKGEISIETSHAKVGFESGTEWEESFPLKELETLPLVHSVDSRCVASWQFRSTRSASSVEGHYYTGLWITDTQASWAHVWATTKVEAECDLGLIRTTPTKEIRIPDTHLPVRLHLIQQ